jgi:hypothetical protein
MARILGRQDKRYIAEIISTIRSKSINDFNGLICTVERRTIINPRHKNVDRISIFLDTFVAFKKRCTGTAIATLLALRNLIYIHIYNE